MEWERWCHVDVTLRNPAPPESSLDAVIEFGAGAHLERLSDEIDEFLHVTRGDGFRGSLERSALRRVAGIDPMVSLLCPYNSNESRGLIHTSTTNLPGTADTWY